MSAGTKSVIVTSAGWQAALNCVQSLGRLGHRVYVLDSHGDPSLARSRYCRGHLPCPDEYASPMYSERVLEVAATGDYDLLIPISDRSVDVASHHREELSRHLRLVLPGRAEIDLARDKAATTRFAADLGIRVPETHYPATMAEVREVADAARYPSVVKAPRGTAGQGVFVVHNAKEAIRCFQTHGTPENWPFIQTFVEGDIADVAAVCDRGELVVYFSFYAEVEHLIGGTPPYVRSLVDPALVETTRRLARALEWHGAIDLDFIRTPAGEHYLIEINPRFSGSTNFAYKLGIDMPRSLVDVAFGSPGRDDEPRFQDGWLFRTVFPAEFIWWRQAAGNRVATVLRNTLRRRTRSNIYWRDPRLVYSQLREAVGIIRNGTRRPD